MRKKIIAFLSMTVLLLGVFYSCKKSNINGDKSDLVPGSYLTLKADGNSKLDWKVVNTSTVSRTFGSFGLPVDKINLYVVKGSNLDPTTWKLIKSLAFTEGIVVNVTGAEIATALGIPASSINTDLTIYSEAVTKDGKKFSMANTPTNFQSFPAYNIAFIWSIQLINYVCPFTNTDFTGTFAIQSDGWNDFGKGDPISVVAGPSATQLTMTLYPAPGVGTNRKNIILDVNPATDSVIVAKQVYGDYPPDLDFSVQGVGTVSICSGIISLSLTHTNAAGNYGTFKVVMKKN